MKTVFSKFLIGFILLVSYNMSYAGSLWCAASSGGYCNYTGKISRVYVNLSNLLLIYTEGMDLSQLSNAGSKFSMVKMSGAIAVDMDKYPVFGKNIYSAALAAFMADRTVTLQCTDNYSSYLQTDRIWVYK